MGDSGRDQMAIERMWPVCKSNYGAFVLHAIDATPARWRGDVGSSPLDGASAAASSPRNDLVKNYRVHPTLVDFRTGARRLHPAAHGPRGLSATRRPRGCLHLAHRFDPHADARPILTLSLLGEEPILVGRSFRSTRACTWEPIVGRSVTLPRRSLLLLGGASGSIAKHCVSACAGPRVSITLRRQPPEDWRPDAADLVGGGGTKRKPLSGSAKRRKKRAKLLN